MKYNDGYLPGSNGYLISKAFPIDVRLVQSLKSDLIDDSKFGPDDYRYAGMLVTVIEDPIPENNGVYLCTSDDFNYDDSDYQCWQKLLDLPDADQFNTGDEIVLKKKQDGSLAWAKKSGGGGSGSGVDSLEDLTDVYVASKEDGQVLSWDASKNKWVSVTPINNLSDLDDVDVSGEIPNGYVLKWNGNKWIAAPDQRGSGSGGDAVTASDIDYRLVFTPTGEGGLGYTERGANGTGLGYLTKAHFASNGTQGIIPAGTSYEDIFRAVLEGEEQLDVIVNTPKTASYSGSNIVFEILRVQAQPSNATIQYSASGSAPWSNTYNNDIHGTDVGTYSGYFRVTKGNKFSTIKEARLIISKKSITVTPNTNKSSYSIGDTISYNAPTYGSGSPTATSDITYTIVSGSTLDTVGSITTSTSASSCTTLNASYPNYTFTAGSKSFTVNPVIQFKKSGANSYSNYYTNYSQMNSDPDMSAYSNIDKNPNGAYMIPLVHRQGTGNEYKLKILGYKINKIYYWDTQNKTWKEDTGSFDYFGTPVQTQVSGLYEYEYTFSKSTNTDAALAISIKK